MISIRIAALSALLATGVLAAPAGLRSGPQPGDRPLPFTSNVVTGKFRGQQHCFVCDLKDEPAVLVFVREPNDGTARLLHNMEDQVREHRSEKLFGWVVFLGEQGTAAETSLESQAFRFARANGVSSVPVSVLGDPQGPPGYLVSRDAAATVLAFRSGKILWNRAYRAKDWNARAADGALKDAVKAAMSTGSPS